MHGVVSHFERPHRLGLKRCFFLQILDDIEREGEGACIDCKLCLCDSTHFILNVLNFYSIVSVANLHNYGFFLQTSILTFQLESLKY